MFDLEEQIVAWKSALVGQGKCSADETLELESHLREDVAALTTAGLSEQEAFCTGVSRLGDPCDLSAEFAKNERCSLIDSIAIHISSALAAAVGLAVVALGLAAWMKKGDGLLGAHVGLITFSYAASFVLALAGTYSVIRAAFTRAGEMPFRERLAAHYRIMLAVIAMACAAGTILGGIWARRNWGRLWAWDPKEIGALAVAGCAFVLYLLLTRCRPGSIRLGQMSLALGLVTFIAWFGPMVYREPVGGQVVGFFVGSLVIQLSILGVSIILAKPQLAEI